MFSLFIIVTQSGVQKGENRNDMYVFKTVMCLLFNGTEINSNILLLKMIDFSPSSHVELPKVPFGNEVLLMENAYCLKLLQ